MLPHQDMKDAPERFFLAHRLLATAGLGGFGIRMTVQFNLFAGSILGLGGPDQVALLDTFQESGSLGCFCLTELQAGVMSGLIVKTTAVWVPEKQMFKLNTPNDAAAKNWISQGMVAEWCVVLADLSVGAAGKSYGPHPFLIRMRDRPFGSTMPGITAVDMGKKTVANDLDNARVWFNDVWMPRDALLNRFADVRGDEYVQVGSERMRLEVIGQRLLTGRLAIAESALVSARCITMLTKKYADSKVCNGIAGDVALGSLPQLATLVEESYAQIDATSQFCAAVEQRLAVCLRSNTIPDADLVEAIGVCKIRAIDVSIERVHLLRMEVGSYALMAGTGFEIAQDMFLCCKFAEGDSRILMQKMARDRLKQLQRAGMLSGVMRAFFATGDSREVRAAISLAWALSGGGNDAQSMEKVWTSKWREVYGLADMICDRHYRNSIAGWNGAPQGFDEPIVARL